MKCLFCLLALCLLLPAHFARADEKGATLLRELIAATEATPGLTADFTITGETKNLKVVRATGKITLQRPNFARIEVTAGAKSNVVEDQTVVSDGKTLWTYLKDFKRCQRTPVETDGGNIMDWCMPVGFFFSPATLRLYSELFDVSTHDLGSQTLDGETYRVLEIVPDTPDFRMTTYHLYLGPDHLIRRVTEEFGQITDRIKLETTLSHLQVVQSLTTSLFHYQPPQNTRIVNIIPPDFDIGLFPVGSGTPGFRLSTPVGKEIELSTLLKENKAVLLAFWFYGCAPCRAEFPGLQALYNAYHDKGLEIVGINNGDEAAIVQRYRTQGKFTFPLALDANGGKNNSTSAAYGVSAFPTIYLLDARGKVLWRSHTFDPDSIRAVLKQQGLR